MSRMSGGGPSHSGFCGTAFGAASQISQPHVIANRAGRNAQRVKKEDCESSPLEFVSDWPSLQDQATTEFRRRRRRTTNANDPRQRAAAEAGSGTAAGDPIPGPEKLDIVVVADPPSLSNVA